MELHVAISPGRLVARVRPVDHAVAGHVEEAGGPVPRLEDLVRPHVPDMRSPWTDGRSVDHRQVAGGEVVAPSQVLAEEWLDVQVAADLSPGGSWSVTG